MKGITHFTIGVAAASCVPSVVTASAQGDPLYFLLGGVLGILPDTLDFKFYRFCFRHDMEIRPDPNAFDAQMVANGVAHAVDRAWQSGGRIRLKLSAVQLDDDRWQSYRVTFDTLRRKVDVKIGRSVDSGGNSVLEKETAVCVAGNGSAALPVSVKLDYFADISVDIFDGPVIELVPDKWIVFVSFLPWHRSWTHSFIIAFVFGLICWISFGMTAGIVSFAAYSMHILIDQLGFMGSNLWFPFSSSRTHGAMKLRSSDAICNFASVWLACLIIFWNLYAGSGLEWRGLTVFKLFFYGAAVPGLLCRLILRRS